jgi:DNA end-binding protein Ku
MAQRPIWRGHLRLALVSCPVALYSAKHERSSIKFNLINPETGNRIQMITQDSGTERPVQRRDLVKGYEFKKNTYLLLSNEDFDSIKVESSEVITVEKFVEADSIDPIYYDSSYFVAPDGQAGRDVYAVLLEAIEKTGRVALARVVIGQRERTIALRPMNGGLAAHTLSEQRDINDAKALFDDVGDIKTDPEMVQLATLLINRQTGRYDPIDIEDRYETRLRELIDAKLKGEGYDVEEASTPAQTNVIDLMAALRKSLASGQDEPEIKPKAAAKAAVKSKAEKPPPVPAKAPRKRAS